jgi:hypothetical protein
MNVVGDVRGRVDDLGRRVRTLVHDRPVAALALAFVAGFAVARVVKA